MGILPVYKDSLFCGMERKDGLQIVMKYEKPLVYADIVVDKRFEGYTDVVHGGIVFGILDVIMWYAIFMESKKIGMTRKTQMEFLKPVICNSPYMAKGELVSIKERDIYASAWMEDSSGEIYAKVDALFREGKNISVFDFINKFDFSHTSPEIKEHFLSLLDTDGRLQIGKEPEKINISL